MSPLGFLHALARRQGPIEVRAAEPADGAAVQRMVQTSTRAYSGMGGAMQEALRDSIALAARQDEKLVGFLMAFPQGPEVAWIHAMGVAGGASTDEVGLALLQALEEELRPRSITWIGYMDEYDLGWLRRLLEKAGYARSTSVIGLETPLHAPPSGGNQAATVRPASIADLPAVARLDRAAFGPLWAYSEQVLAAVLGQVACYLVAELSGEPVGYILCTSYDRQRVHIVRLAVEPRVQAQGIGARLLAEAWARFSEMGVRWVSLNTQEENLRSQRLYRWFGFQPSGDQREVWAKPLSGV